MPWLLLHLLRLSHGGLALPHLAVFLRLLPLASGLIPLHTPCEFVILLSLLVIGVIIQTSLLQSLGCVHFFAHDGMHLHLSIVTTQLHLLLDVGHI